MKFNLHLISLLVLTLCYSCNNKQQKADDSSVNTLKSNKLIIYQLLPRLFGNKDTTNKFYGAIEDNGVGKFNDINDKALQELKKLGVTHVWYTGVIEHATMTDYSKFGILRDDPDVVKGIAGSPYAIKDYYDVDPDLAVDVNNRMKEYEALIIRTHQNGLKAMMDFIPNHVARTYHSDAKPANVKDFGEDDDETLSFSTKNDFYYIPGKSFQVPAGYIAGGKDYQSPMKDGKFKEVPAKATGNNVFKADPNLDDWFETIKLNYGVDVLNNQNHFEPIPPVWMKMKDILIYWAKKGVDGFRCDVAEMVPVAFWSWVIPEVKKVNPDLIFMGEAYDPTQYKTYINKGKFDFLYDKVGLYDGLKRLIKDEANADVMDIHKVTHQESVNIPSHMMRFLENHDEERIASQGFAKDPKYAMPAMVITATLGGGPVMIYSGQEVGEPANKAEGFGGLDNRTSIFDYWGVPNHQKWMNNGAFDGGKLNEKEKNLRNFYQKLLNFSSQNEVIKFGNTIELNEVKAQQNIFGKKVYAYIRNYKNKHILVIANFNRTKNFDEVIQLPESLMKEIVSKQGENITAINILSGNGETIKDFSKGIKVNIKPSDALILSF